MRKLTITPGILKRSCDIGVSYGYCIISMFTQIYQHVPATSTRTLFFKQWLVFKNKSKCFACFYPIAFFFGWHSRNLLKPGPPSEPLAWTRQERSQKVNLQFSMWKNSRRASHKQAQHAMNIHGANHGATGVFSQIQPAVHRSIPYITQIRRSIWIFFGNIYGNIIWIIHFGLFSQFDSVFP